MAHKEPIWEILNKMTTAHGSVNQRTTCMHQVFLFGQSIALVILGFTSASISMYKLSALLTSLIGLSGCINGETVANNITGRVVSVDGTWLSNCVVEGAISSKTTIINTNGTGSISEQTYSDTTCTTTSMLEGAEYTYELRDAVTVDGTVDGITTATKIDVTYTSGVVGSEFNIVAIKDTQVMYFGDGGTTDALRPAQLDGSLVYTRQ